MNKYNGFCLIISMMILMFSCSPSSNNNNEQNENNNSLKETTNLEEDSLTAANIKVFEQRSIQKLQDLKDYFEIISDPHIDTIFINQATEMAKALFSSKDKSIEFPIFESQENQIQKVDSFFSSLKNSTNGKLSLEIRNISVLNNIEQLGDSEYGGSIKFRLFISNKQKTYKIDMQCNIIVKRVQKTFGKESKQVWEVFLGDILKVP